MDKEVNSLERTMVGDADQACGSVIDQDVRKFRALGPFRVLRECDAHRARRKRVLPKQGNFKLQFLVANAIFC